MKTLPPDFPYVPEMYDDGYFPNPLVDKVRDAIQEAVAFIEEGHHTTDEIQAAFDRMTEKIDGLQSEFEEAGSELETVARDSIGLTVKKLLEYFKIGIDVEHAIGLRDW